MDGFRVQMDNGDTETRPKIHLTPSVYHFGYDLRIGLGLHDKFIAAEPLEFKTHSLGETVPVVANLERKELEALMDELWNAGIRPSNGEGSVGVIGAMKAHITDLQKNIEFDRMILSRTTIEFKPSVKGA